METPPRKDPPRATLSPDYQRDWNAYFTAVREQPARETCTLALNLFEQDPRPDSETGMFAIDLACGEGRDTREILRRTRPSPWFVLAIDGFDDAARRFSPGSDGTPDRVAFLQLTMEQCASAGRLRSAVEARRSSMPPSEHVRSPRFSVQLVNASFALPFCHEDAFASLWIELRNLLAPGGRFAGQFFGDRDEWAQVNRRRHVSREQALQLLDGLVLERFDEVEKVGSDAMGGVKHHHVFHVVARNPAPGSPQPPPLTPTPRATPA